MLWAVEPAEATRFKRNGAVRVIMLLLLLVVPREENHVTEEAKPVDALKNTVPEELDAVTTFAVSSLDTQME